MNQDPSLFDPDFEGLLRDIASDPRSRLLRVERPRALRGVFERSPTMSAATAGLTMAERHLVSVHRAELAWLMRQACISRFSSEETFGPWFGPYIGMDQRHEPIVFETWRDAVMLEEHHRYPAPGLEEPYELLEACIRGPGFGGVTIADMAVVSMRFEPTDQARIHLAFDLARTQPLASLRILRETLRGRPSETHASYAWQIVALCFSILGRGDAALEAARLSSEHGESRPEALLNWVYHALMARNRKGATSASRALADSMNATHPALASFTRQLSEQRTLGSWNTDASTKAFVASRRDDLDSAARRIADVLL